MTRSMRSAGAEPLTPRREWQTILLGTLLLVPAYWSIMAGLVSVAAEDEGGGPQAGAAIAFGLCLIPFIYIVLAFMSGHPQAPGAVVRALVLTVLIGIPVSALAGDAVTGIVAGVGAGGVVAIRQPDDSEVKSRALGVAFVSLYMFVLVRAVGAAALASAPVFPFTVIGLADHLAQRRR